MDENLADNIVAPLADLLLSSSEESDPSSELLDILRGRARDLSGCFGDFDAGKIGFVAVADPNLVCRDTEIGTKLYKIGDGPGIETVSDGNALLVGAAIGDRELFLFLPADYRRGVPFE